MRRDRLVLWNDLGWWRRSYHRGVSGFLRALWAEPPPPDAPPRRRRDWALVVALVSLALLEGAVRADLPWRVATVVVGVGLAPTLLWRRSRPLLMIVIAFGVTGLGSILVRGNFPQSYTAAAMLVLVYALTRWGSGQAMLLGAAVVAGKAGLVLTAREADTAEVVGGFAVLTAVLAAGAALRYRAGARARALEQVRLVERERLARDLHDTVAHHVSAIAIRAQAGLAVAGTDPAAAIGSLRVIEAEASRALAEMRTMVRILRHDSANSANHDDYADAVDLAPSPRIADLVRLAAGDGTGVPVHVAVGGEVADLPPLVQSAVYRLAQESVTNARRHARHATRIHVRVEADDAAVHLRVSDDGETAPAGAPGYGLIGMAERADLLGGSCHAAPDPGRGWTVTATLPRTSPGAAEPRSAEQRSAEPSRVLPMPPRTGSPA